MRDVLALLAKVVRLWHEPPKPTPDPDVYLSAESHAYWMRRIENEYRNGRMRREEG
jgi:hypothetical protein